MTYNIGFEAGVTVEAESFEDAFNKAHAILGELFTNGIITEPYIVEVMNEDTGEAERY